MKLEYNLTKLVNFSHKFALRSKRRPIHAEPIKSIEHLHDGYDAKIITNENVKFKERI